MTPEERVAQIAREVWKRTGWGDGEPECAEGNLCRESVKAGYEAGRLERENECNWIRYVKGMNVSEHKDFYVTVKNETGRFVAEAFFHDGEWCAYGEDGTWTLAAYEQSVTHYAERRPLPAPPEEE